MFEKIITYLKTKLKSNIEESAQTTEESMKIEEKSRIEEMIKELNGIKINNELKKDTNKVCRKLKKSDKIELTQKQRKILKRISSGRHIEADAKIRANIILKLENNKVKDVEKNLQISKPQVIKWKKRWIESFLEINRIEQNEPWKLKEGIRKVLRDAYRSGKKSTFRLEQKAHIIYLSLQDPESCGVPISHWTPEALAQKAIEEKIVDKISGRQIGRYLEELDIKVHQYKGWLNSKDKVENPEEFEKNVKEVCKIYETSKELAERGVHVISSDEKTSIQALEHKNVKKLVMPGEVEKCEQEYIRHGTTTLIAARDINTGQIIAPMVQETRNEEDYLKHISDIVKLAPNDEYIFIMDQLNTHKSESLVRYIAEQIGFKGDLGKKDKKGILKSMPSRAEFLSNPEHRIRIVYTPKHASWMNQIEIWFSILSRMLLNKRKSFKSVEELNSKILEFIDYYNENLAKPFKWTYAGKLLKA